MPAVVVGRDAELAVAPRFRRGDLRRASRARARGRGGHGEDDALAGGVARPRSAGRPRARRRGRPRARRRSRFRVSATCSTRFSTRRSSHCRPSSASARRVRSCSTRRRARRPNAHAVGVALLSALRGLAAERPVLVAIDDSQWLDAASAAALAYGVRRLESERVGLLLARRRGSTARLSTSCALAPAAGCTTSTSARSTPRRCTASSRSHLGVVAAPTVACRGAPGFGRKSVLRARDRAHAPAARLSIEAGPAAPRARVAARPRPRPPARAAVRESRLPARCGCACAPDDLDHRGGIGRPRERRARAGSRGAHRRARRRANPLHASAARRRRLEAAPPLRRAEVHARLAELLEDPEARAWQLAASVDEPDESVAAALEDAAEHARARGAPTAGRASPRPRERADSRRGSRRLASAARVDAAYLTSRPAIRGGRRRSCASFSRTLPPGSGASGVC